MPLYEFCCDDGHTFEHEAKLKDFDLPVKCPICNKKAHHVISTQKVVHSSVSSWRIPLNQKD